MNVTLNKVNGNGETIERKTLVLRTAEEIAKSVIAIETVTLREVVARYFGELNSIFS